MFTVASYYTFLLYGHNRLLQMILWTRAGFIYINTVPPVERKKGKFDLRLKMGIY